MPEFSRRRFLETAGSLAGGSLLGAPRAQARQGLRAAGGITLACADYARFLPLGAGDVRPRGISLTWLRGERAEMLRRATSDPAVDGGEGSMAQHLLRVARGDRSLVAVPVFLLRNFAARDIYTLKGSSVTPTTLEGRRIGIYNWAASGAIWYRHLVRYFRQNPAAVKWVVASPEQATPVAVAVPLPSHVTLGRPGASLVDLLLGGEIDAFFAPLPPKKYHPTDGPIVRLIPDFRAAEKRYFKETGCYPPQHVLLVRQPVWERDPSIGRQLVETFNECEARFAGGQRLFPYGTPWLLAELEETELLMGQDFHAHGLEKNHHPLDVFCRSGFEDGLTERRITVEEFFAEFLKT
jgi:4,5-dihydroxyphthalate decarboxylase